jgi:FtsZ-interacting cell division protein YlmF
MFVTLKDLDEAALLTKFIVKNRICIVKIAVNEPRGARRIHDFLMGAAYSQGYHVESINENVNLFSPGSIEINNSLYGKNTGGIYRRKGKAR